MKHLWYYLWKGTSAPLLRIWKNKEGNAPVIPPALGRPWPNFLRKRSVEKKTAEQLFFSETHTARRFQGEENIFLKNVFVPISDVIKLFLENVFITCNWRCFHRMLSCSLNETLSFLGSKNDSIV